jgi:hypothetical protein
LPQNCRIQVSYESFRMLSAIISCQIRSCNVDNVSAPIACDSSPCQRMAQIHELQPPIDISVCPTVAKHGGGCHSVSLTDNYLIYSGKILVNLSQL